LSTNFTFGKTFAVTTALTVVWSPALGFSSYERHHTLLGVLWCRSGCPSTHTPLVIVVVALLFVEAFIDDVD
jgi:hypothetical protein